VAKIIDIYIDFLSEIKIVDDANGWKKTNKQKTSSKPSDNPVICFL
jgi:hypothetical protein